jgi:hypothetical protein
MKGVLIEYIICQAMKKKAHVESRIRAFPSRDPVVRFVSNFKESVCGRPRTDPTSGIEIGEELRGLYLA